MTMKAQKVWFEDGRIMLLTHDGRVGSLPVRMFPRLYNATEKQRNHYELSHFGIHWPDIDEDLSYEGFFDARNDVHSDNPIRRVFCEFPELRITQVARSAGLNATLLQQYVDGYKTPSDKRRKQIEDVIHRLGQELSKVSLA